MSSKYTKVGVWDFVSKVLLGMASATVVYLVFLFFTNSSTPTKDDENYISEIKSKYAVYAFPVPQKITFAGETMPLENFDVKESLDKEIQKVAFWHSEIFLYLKRANRFFPIVEPILKENNIPDDMKYLMIAESGMDNVASPAKAEGYWQFMKGTGLEYDLEITDEIDERYHIEKSTIAACKYLKYLYKKYEKWNLVAAAYNMGQGALDDNIAFQKENNYYDLLLNPETARYVYRIVALKLVMENPKDYGFRYRKKDLYPTIQVTKLKVDSSVTSWVNFSKSQNINYKMLRYFNPWIKKNKLTNTKKKVYYISIPKEGARSYDYVKDISTTDTIY